MHVWEREVPIFEESVIMIKVESKETIGKNKSVSMRSNAYDLMINTQ